MLFSIFKACFVSENPHPPNHGMANSADSYSPAVTTHHIRVVLSRERRQLMDGEEKLIQPSHEVSLPAWEIKDTKI